MNKYQKPYVIFLKKFLVLQKPLKIVFDCSNGSIGPIVRQLIINNRQLITKIINEKPDGNFPAHGPDPSAQNATSDFKKAVLKNKADLGVIFDADGDRVFFMDDKGRILDTDIAANLLIIYLQPKKIIINTPIGWLIRKNFKFFESKVGRSYLEKMMEEKDADFGVEYSGHYYFKNFFYRDSGIMAAIEFINAVSKLPYKLSDFVDLSPQYFRTEINLRLTTNNLQQKLEKIKKAYKDRVVKTSKKDGLFMEFKDFWFCIRPSNTEPLLRIYAEATNKQALDKQKKILLNLLNGKRV